MKTLFRDWPRLGAVWLCAALMAGLAVSGCGGRDQDGVGPQERRMQIAVIPKGLAHQFWLTVRAGAEAAGEELEVDIIWQGPSKETEIIEQINIVQDMISRRVNALVLAACDENALVRPIEQALRASIPVITIDSGVQSDLPLSFIATDNEAGAAAAADALAELLGGEGQVALLPFVRGAGTSEMRERGFREGLKAHPGLDLVAVQYTHSDVARAMDITQDLLTAHPDLKGIFAANEAGAIGAAQALRVEGKAGEVKLVAFDASDEQINALQQGVIQALIVQDPFRMGHEGVHAAVNAIRGIPVEPRVDTGVTVVTQDNFDEPEVQALLNPAL